VMAALQGHLRKLGEAGPINSWKRRWFIQKGSKLHYYANKGDSEEKEKGFINLEEAFSVQRATESKKSVAYAFRINTPRRVYHLQAESEDQLDYWVNGLNDVLKTLQNKAESPSIPLVKRTSVLPGAHQTTDKDVEIQLLKKALELASHELKTTPEELIERAKVRSSKPIQLRTVTAAANTATPNNSPDASAKPGAASTTAAASATAAEEEEEEDVVIYEAKVLYDYTPRRENELRIAVDEIVQVLGEFDNGWLLGVNPAQEKGFFPASFVEKTSK